MPHPTSSPTSPRITVCSLAMGMASTDVLANHRAFAERSGYIHATYVIGGDDGTDRTRLLRKYSRILSLVQDSDDKQILVFAEDSLAFAGPLPISDVLGDAPFWLCQDGHWRDRGNGGLIITRGGAQAAERIEAILGHCQRLAPDSWSFRRWEHAELIGQHTHDHDTLIQGRYPNLLFPSFGHALPGVSAWAMSFNPHILPHAQDHYSNTIVIRHLTECLHKNIPAFNLTTTAREAFHTHIPLEGKLSPVALVLVITPEQASVAGLVEDNLRHYAMYHGYALSIHREETAIGPNPLAALLRHASQDKTPYQCIFCMTADVLIHNLKRPITRIFAGASLVLARSAWGHNCDIGLIGVRTDEIGKALMEAAHGSTLGMEQRIGGILQSAIAQGRAHLPDFTTLAPHTAFRDPANFLVRYQALPDNVRNLVMHSDGASLPDQLLPPPPPPAMKTSLSFLRKPRLYKLLLTVLSVAGLIAAIQQSR